MKPIPEHCKLDINQFDVLLYDASGSSVDNDRLEAENFDYCGVLNFLIKHQEITICTGCQLLIEWISGSISLSSDDE